MADPALAFFRSHREGVLRADGTHHPVRFVADARTGAVVFPAPPGVLDAEELVLFIPEEAPADGDSLQILLAASETRDEFACDRWRFYHGDPPWARWAACEIVGGRLGPDVFDPAVLNAPNPLAPEEAALCRQLNADRAKLAVVCRIVAGVTPEDPVAVGVDPGGIDVRARFGTIRLGFAQDAETPGEARRRIASFFGSARP